MGADIIKTEYTGSPESFHELCESVYVPVVILGGSKKVSEEKLLTEIKEALAAGGAGIAMGRNIWGHENPARYASAIAKIIHEDCSVESAFKRAEQEILRGRYMQETYKVAILSGERKVEIVEKELKQPTGNQVLVKVSYCAICTLEQRIYSGIMKRYPFAGGHEAAGTVSAVGGQSEKR